ncbi:MAG: hypothetical protein SPLUMA2_SPLUMAMAG2_01894 [uncultured Sulfurimonas sp.]|nr:MAG: hypothetical protein SPLUMA2_SPLUMAMAG2_01894 [uncultured Sulfurimonas sp.]
MPSSFPKFVFETGHDIKVSRFSITRRSKFLFFFLRLLATVSPPNPPPITTTVYFPRDLLVTLDSLVGLGSVLLHPLTALLTATAATLAAPSLIASLRFIFILSSLRLNY